jgi:4-amino-4-deoxy-L-arabinose transferase-like glycosyltransferase
VDARPIGPESATARGTLAPLARLGHEAAAHVTANRLLLLVAAAGLSLRVVWVLHVDPFPFGDAYWYVNVAQNLIEGHGFAANPHGLLEPPGVPKATAYYPPLYPFTLAALWKIIGFSLTSGKLLNACLDTLTIFLVYDIGRRIFTRRDGLVAAAVYAVLPSAVLWLPLLLSEALFTLLFSAALWVLIASRPSAEVRRPTAALGFGLLTGLALLTRGVGTVLPVAAAVFWLARDGRRAALRQLLLALVAAAAVIVPWTARNWIVMGTPIVVSSNTGYNLRIGHSEGANGTFGFLPDTIDGVDSWRSLDRPDLEVRGYRVYARRALGYALTHPLRELQLATSKIYYLYRSDAEVAPALTTWSDPLAPRALEDVLEPLVTATWFLLLFAAVASAFVWLRRTPQRLLLAAAFLFWTAFHVIFFGLARYHLGLLPLMAVVATGGSAESFAAARAWMRRTVASRAGPTRD